MTQSLRQFLSRNRSALVLLTAAATMLLTAGSVQAKTTVFDEWKAGFEGRTVTAQIKMPATSEGIDVRIPPDFSSRIESDPKKFMEAGTGILAGQMARITKFKVKGKTIEVHLNGGGKNFFKRLNCQTPSKGHRPTDCSSRFASGGSRVNLRFEKDVKKLADQLSIERIERLLAGVLQFQPAAQPGTF